MLTSYFKTAWRNLVRHPTSSIIKVIGLSIGLTVCMLIFLYTKDELSYDQFHDNKSRIFRIVQNWKMAGQPDQTIGITNAIVGGSFAKEIPEVQQYVRINGTYVTVKKNNDVFTENPLFVDDNFFSVFSFPLLAGDKRNALKDLHAVVLSEDLARKYFGTVDAIGKTLQIKTADEFDNFTVTAIAKNAPQNSTLTTGMLFNYKYFDRFNDNHGWFGGSLNTFLLLSPQANSSTVESKMQTIFDRNTKDFIAKAEKEHGMTVHVKLLLQPITDIHLGKPVGPDNGMADGSSPVYSYILTCIAFFILVIACINFINLAVTQSLKRSKEIGIRKVVGGIRGQLIGQFLTESFLVSFIAFLMAIALTALVLPLFDELANKKLSLAYLSDGYLFAGYFLLLIATSFIAGVYPSIVASSFQPVKVLYHQQKMAGRNYLTKGLIVLQFSLSIFLIIGTIVVNSQLNFLLHKDLGYDSRDLVRINIPVSNASNGLPALFKNELLGRPNIINVAAKNRGRSISGAQANNKNIDIEQCRIEENFLPEFNIPMIEGRNFSAGYPADSTHSVIVNESFVKAAGWNTRDAVGKTIKQGEDNRLVTIIGVIKDYHFASLKEKITPEVLCMQPGFNYGEIWVKINPGNLPQTLALLQNTYRKLVPYFPYSYSFLNDINAKNYEIEEKWKQIISIASGLFIFISCMGLLGLIMLSIAGRTKEIGIRKVLGAAISRIVLLVSKEFIILISLAFLVAVPAGYYFANRWLQDFAYRIDMEWWMFVVAGILILGIALLTISYHALKAAIANPANSLRTE
jgi:ABC-type antimicrobial peptide transport system permease subunit